MTTTRGRLALAALPTLFIGYLFIYPVTRILLLSLGEGFVDVFASQRVRSAIWFTVWQAAASTVLTVIAAMPLTAVLSRYSFRGRELVRALVTVPFVLPTVVVGSAFVALGLRGNIWAILGAHVFFNLAVVVRTVGGVWSRLDPSIVGAARVLGAGPWRAFLKVTLPVLGPSIAAAMSIVFLFTFTSFGVVLIVGGLAYRTIEVQIYQEVTTFLDLGTAGTLALVQLVGVSAALWVYSRYQREQSTALNLVAEHRVLRPAETLRQRTAVWATVVFTLGAVITPLGVLVARSLSAGGAGWKFLIDPGPVAVAPLEAIRNSLGFALAGATIATIVGISAATVIARGPTRSAAAFDTVLMLPLGTSAVTVGLGFLIALDRPIDLRGTIALVPLAHALVAVPFVVRATLPTLRAIRQDIREAAAILGAAPRQVWRHVDLPLTARAMMIGTGFAAAVSLGEFGATAFIVRPGSATIPTLIFGLLGRPGGATYGAAMALSVILMILTTLLILSIDRLRAGELGTF